MLNKINLIPSKLNEHASNYKPLENYEIYVYGYSDKKQQLIRIYNNEYVAVDGKMFKIIGNSDISVIYDLVITEPQDAEIDESYYSIKRDKS